MTLPNELQVSNDPQRVLPAIHQLDRADKQVLLHLLERELHPAPDLTPEDFPNEGQWLLAVFDRHIHHTTPGEAPPIAPRKPHLRRSSKG